MLKIGITGGIGSGKTTICKVFETLGIPVFYADAVAKQIMVTDPILIKEVIQAFGDESYFADGSLNNKYISNIVFKAADQLVKLNAIVHPAVFRAFDHWFQQVPSTVPYVLKEAALLFESGSYKMCDYNVLVIAPNDLKISRVQKRDEVTEEQVISRMTKQFSDEEKSEYTDLFMVNDETKSIVSQVLAYHRQFLNPLNP
jgi:dephospho-CoA kinase